MIYDRRPFYLIGGAVALLVVGFFVFFTPRITAEQRVREQLSLLSTMPWTRVQVREVEYLGALENPEQALVRGQRVEDGSPVVIHFIEKSPYTAANVLRRLTEQPLDGRVAEVLMVPRSIAHTPFRDDFLPEATHVGVALFAGFPDRPDTTASNDGGATAPAGSVAPRSTDG